jgi:hypothetical protein
VNGAGPDHHQNAPIGSCKNVANLLPGLKDRGRGLLGRGKFFFKKNRRQDNFGPFDAEVVSGIKHAP